MLDTILVFLLLIIIFSSGILFEKYLLNKNNHNKNMDFFTKEDRKSANQKQNAISIDDTKIVMGLQTSNMEAKHKELGQTTESKDNTQSAISKLKNMKGR
tara:strand:- start:2895 stop:3194 length:300 start_codon:yes stop_codon:yes gene_type:complete